MAARRLHSGDTIVSPLVRRRPSIIVMSSFFCFVYFVLGIVYPPRDFAYKFIGFVLMSGVCSRWVLFFNDVFVVVAARRWPSGDTIVSPLGWRRPSIIEMSSFFCDSCTLSSEWFIPHWSLFIVDLTTHCLCVCLTCFGGLPFPPVCLSCSLCLAYFDLFFMFLVICRVPVF